MFIESYPLPRLKMWSTCCSITITADVSTLPLVTSHERDTSLKSVWVFLVYKLHQLSKWVVMCFTWVIGYNVIYIIIYYSFTVKSSFTRTDHPVHDICCVLSWFICSYVYYVYYYTWDFTSVNVLFITSTFRWSHTRSWPWLLFCAVRQYLHVQCRTCIPVFPICVAHTPISSK